MAQGKETQPENFHPLSGSVFPLIPGHTLRAHCFPVRDLREVHPHQLSLRGLVASSAHHHTRVVYQGQV